jgi:small-conductance mechanosensitive channel
MGVRSIIGRRTAWLRIGVFVACALGDPAASAAQSRAESTATRAAVAADSAGRFAAVVIEGDTVLRLSARLGPFSASDRAEAVARRLQSAAASGADSVRVVPGEGADELLVGDRVLMSVTDDDARSAGRPRAALAAAWALRLTDALRAAQPEARMRDVLVGAGWTLVTTLGFLLVLWGLSRGLTWLRHTMTAWRSARVAGVRLGSYELLSADRLVASILGAARAMWIVLLLVLAYVYVPLVLGFFRWTRPYASTLRSAAVVPVERVLRAVLDYLPDLFFLIVIVLATRLVLRVVRLVFEAIGRGALAIDGFDREWADPTYKIVRFLVLAFALVMLFPYLPGSNSEAFKGVSIFLGVLLSLGSSSAIGNLVAGVVLTYTRAFRLGDRVQIGETTGDVVMKTLLVTRIRTIKQVDVTIPNAVVLASHVLNYSAMAANPGVILHSRVTIGYDAPWRTVEALLVAAARATPGVLATPAPFVLQTSLDDWYVSYEINAYTDQPATMAGTYSRLHAEIQDRFNAAGLEIMSPQYLAARDGNRAAMDPREGASAPAPGAFRVRRAEPE